MRWTHGGAIDVFAQDPVIERAYDRAQPRPHATHRLRKGACPACGLRIEWPGIRDVCPRTTAKFVTREEAEILSPFPEGFDSPHDWLPSAKAWRSEIRKWLKANKRASK